MKRFVSVLIVMLLILSVAACGQPTDEPSGDTGDQPSDVAQEFIIALETDIVQFDPIKIGDATTSSVAYQVYEHLLRRNSDGTLGPGLAESYETDETGQVWTFHLRQGVKFHDGSDFNADVVKWHFERAKSDDSNFKNQFGLIETIETPDEYTVVFTLSGPSAAFADYAIMTNGGYIPSKKAFDEKGDQFAAEPVGTGPFKWGSWVQGQRVELVRNDDWWGEGPKLDKVIYRIIPEANTQVIELETGGVHLITRGSQDDLERLQEDGDFEVKVSAAYRNRFYSLNTARAPMDDILIRRAFNLALDMPTIVNAIASPLTVPTDSLVPMASWAYAGEGVLTALGYDPDMAEELIQEAGYVKNADGKYEKDGQPLAVTVHSPDGRYFMDKEISEAAKHELEKIGFTVEIKVMEWGAFLDEVRAGDFQVAFLGWNQSSPEPSLFTSALAMTGCRDKDGSFSNAALDAVRVEAMVTPDIEDRKPLYAQAQQIVNDNAWYVWIGNEAIVWIYPKTVSGFNPTPAVGGDYTQLVIGE